MVAGGCPACFGFTVGRGFRAKAFRPRALKYDGFHQQASCRKRQPNEGRRDGFTSMHENSSEIKAQKNRVRLKYTSTYDEG